MSTEPKNPRVVDGARVERRRPRTPEEVERGYLEAAEKTRKRGAMEKLVSAPGGRDVWNARRSVMEAIKVAREEDDILRDLSIAREALQKVITVLGGSALLAAPAEGGAA